MSYALDVRRSLSLSMKQFDSAADVDTALNATQLAEGSFVSIRRPTIPADDYWGADPNYANWFIVSKKFVDTDNNGVVEQTPVLVRERATFGVDAIAHNGTTVETTEVGFKTKLSIGLNLKSGTPLKITGGKLDYTDISIAATSQGSLTYDPTTRQLSVTSLASFEYVISTESTLDAFVTNDSQLTAMRRGDIVFLPTGDLTYLCTYTGTGTPAITDFIQYETPSIAKATVLGWFGTEVLGALNYNPVTGKYKLNIVPSKGLHINADNQLELDETYVKNLITGSNAITVVSGDVQLIIQDTSMLQSALGLKVRLDPTGGILLGANGLYLDPDVINNGINGVTPISYDNATQAISLAFNASLKVVANKLGVNAKPTSGIIVDANGVSLGGNTDSIAWSLTAGSVLSVASALTVSATSTLIQNQLQVDNAFSYFKTTDGKYAKVVFDANNNYYPTVVDVVTALPA